MGMGTYANHADTVEEQFVKEQCPELFDDLKVVLDEVDVGFDQFASLYDEYQGQDKSSDLTEEEDKKITEAYEKLQKAFEEKTGLSLGIRYHEADDRGDEVNGAFWEVSGVYQLTPAGEKYKDKIERKFWTTWR